MSFPALPIVYGYTRILRVDVKEILRGDLKTERHWRNRRVRHAFEIPLPALTISQRAAVESFFASCRGRIFGSIAFTDPWDSENYTCRLDADELSLSSDLSHWSGSLRLIEVANFKAIKSPIAEFPATIPFQLPYSRTVQYSTVVQGQEDGGEKRYEDWASPLRSWIVGGSALTDAQAAALLNAWEGSGGPYRSFNFTEPISSTVYTAHFGVGELTHTIVGPGVNSVQTPVKELK